MIVTNDTIYAPSGAIGGAIVVIRVSGDDCARIAKSILDRNVTKHPQMLLHTLILEAGEPVDDCMAVFFRAPRSYTGEDMLELHCHGGMQTVQAVLRCLAATGARPAAGGEFTRRAFLAGKMDLTQAEAVMDVINAEAEAGLKAALSQLGGSVSRTIHAVEDLLLDARSAIEAAIDYPDEAEADTYAALPASLSEAQAKIRVLIADGRKGRVLRDGLKLVILGKPNVGKSSLLNALLGEERAIVTSVAGTTRDVLDEHLSLRGVPVRLIDTAGLRDTGDEVERIGVSRAKQMMELADVLLVVLDGTDVSDVDRTLLEQTAGRNRIVISNKADLGVTTDADVAVSCKTGEGMDALIDRIVAMATPDLQDGVCITNERHIHALELAELALEHAQAAQELDCIATDLRDALHHLGEITGTDVDAAVIDRIFANFCVGK